MARLKLKEIIWLLMIFDILQICKGEENDWGSCEKVVPGCVCKHFDQKKQAACNDSDFTEIPDRLSKDTQSLILDRNNIRILKEDVFINVNLINLHKLSLRSCQIQDINKHAFRGLAILMNIDLSFNMIKRLDPIIFEDVVKLRMLYLTNNSLQTLESGLFKNLTSLQTVEMSHNSISHIERETFTDLKILQLNLEYNHLTSLEPSIFKNVDRISSLDVRNNPWNCDCKLREFFNLYERISPTPVVCSNPDYLKNQNWGDLKAEDFACKPVILYSGESDFISGTIDDELTLSCRITGDPEPEAQWTFNAKILSNNTSPEIKVYENSYEDYIWRNITITRLIRSLEGVYTCGARNQAGMIEKNVSVSIQSGTWPLNESNSSILLLCVVIALVCCVIIIFLGCYFCCRRAEKIATKKPVNNSITTNGDITHHIILEPEQQKTLLTAVNPVQKPPRKYDSSPQSENGGSELTELNRNLLDDTSVQGTSITGDSMEDRRSTNSLEQLSSYNSQNNLLLQDHPRFINRSHHPPDLLAFSSRRMQASPANSSISNDLENSRLRLLHSPVRSPIYQTHAHSPSYETLLYSRTQSPFSPTLNTPVISQRQGYVTMPRRHRVSSWTSAPTPTIEEALCKIEPVYDNLGPRTTADGSSVLSLTRKIMAESPSNNLRMRPLPPTPLYSSHTLPNKSKLNHVFLSIREKEELHFCPVKETGGVIRPLPLQQSPSPGRNMFNTLDKKRTSWGPKHSPETGILKKPLCEMSPSPKLGTGTMIKSKVPPKPPPKPKKNGLFFDDEGEDGTEV